MRVYYDGLCMLCSTEINHYRRQKGADRIQFVDITSATFDAGAEGLDPFLVHKVMHVKNDEGQLVTGVEAFVEIWKQLPAFHWLVKASNFYPVKQVMNLGYRGFVVLRPYLPRRKQLCEDSPYCEMKERKL